MNDVACESPPVLTDTQARLEASRCLMCEDPPCVAACPAQVPVMHFIRALRFDSPRRAINLIRERNVLAGVCGLTCPVDELCVGACSATELSTPIAIGKLQHYAAETELRTGRTPKPGAGDGKKVAIIGAGPSGLAAAAELARLGHVATVLEKNPRPGGICTYGAPPQRVPQNLVAAEIEQVRSLGVRIETAAPFGVHHTVDDLLAGGYGAVYLAVGLQQAITPGIPGEDLEGVVTWKELLDGFCAAHLGEGDEPSLTSQVIIVGGGSVAMDVAGAARRLGAEDIDVVCLEGPDEMPACRDELEEARQAGVRLHPRSMPLEITAEDGKVSGLKVVRIRWKEPGRFVPDNAESIAGTEYRLLGSSVVFAIGAQPAPELSKALPGVKLDRGGRVVVDPETGATSRAGVFAGGDIAAGGGTTIVKSVAEGRRAARAIDDYLHGEK